MAGSNKFSAGDVCRAMGGGVGVQKHAMIQYMHDAIGISYITDAVSFL